MLLKALILKATAQAVHNSRPPLADARPSRTQASGSARMRVTMRSTHVRLGWSVTAREGVDLPGNRCVVNQLSGSLYLRALKYFALIAMTCAAYAPMPLLAQTTSQPKSAASQSKASDKDLTEGLLDLLNEPGPAKRQESQTEQTSNSPSVESEGQAQISPPTGTAPSLVPRTGRSSGNPQGEDLGSSPDHPLEQVHAGMQTAAGWLRDRNRVDKTQGLQQDIIARLDELISDLEQQAPQSSASSGDDSNAEQGPAQNKTSSASAAASSNSQATGDAQQSSASNGDPDQPPSAGGDQQGANKDQPGLMNSGQRKSAAVDLNDPTALQRSAWGNLPDRVREQMQSRMVERFLPSYREEIEAYYRALVK